MISDPEESERALLISERAILRMILSQYRRERVTRIFFVVGYLILIVALIILREWFGILTMIAIGVLMFVLFPNSEKIHTRIGWKQASRLCIDLAIRHDAPLSLIREMNAANSIGPPSDRSTFDQVQMRVKELDKILGETNDEKRTA